MSLWTLPQRRGLLLLLCVFWLILAGRYGLTPAYLGDAPDAPAPRASELADRLDPNSATWQELAAIPSLGEKRAQSIVAYRDAFHAAQRQERAFGSLEDMTRVKGIGASTASNLEPYLYFPSQRGSAQTRATLGK